MATVPTFDTPALLSCSFAIDVTHKWLFGPRFRVRLYKWEERQRTTCWGLYVYLWRFRFFVEYKGRGHYIPS